MRVPTYTVVVPLLTFFAYAQDAPPTQPQRPNEASQASMADKTSKDKSKDKNKDKEMDKDKDKDKTAGQASSGRMEEMKTQSYSGTLMDASCAGSSAAPSTAASASADRSAPSADTPSCPVSASTTQFAIKLKDGQTAKFDSVGNMRAQEAFKMHKKWSDSASASKPVRVKVSGVMSGDKLTVVSIN